MEKTSWFVLLLVIAGACKPTQENSVELLKTPVPATSLTPSKTIFSTSSPTVKTTKIFPSYTPENYSDPSMTLSVNPRQENELPQKILEYIHQDLIARTGTNINSIQVIKTEAVTWRDGSLGCPQKGEVYIQVLLEGYQIILAVGGQVFDYRATKSGFFKLCDQMNGIKPLP
jgi:hypothetical protein